MRKIKNTYWLKTSISFFLISILFSINYVKEYFNNLYLFNKFDVYLTIASINGIFFAIFFSIILVAVQHSATNYLPSILEKFKKDGKLIFIVVLSMLSIFLNVFFYLSEINHLLVLSLLIFFMSLLSIIFYFYEMLTFLSPLFLVKDLKGNILMKMKKLKKRATKQTRKEIAGTFLEKLPFLAQEIKLNGREYQEKNIEEINKLFNHIERANVINDFETYKESLESLSQIVNYYLLSKKIDSQQDRFIEYVLTKLKLQADFLIGNNEHFKVIEIINTLKKISISSLENLQILHFRGLNYIASLVSYYLEGIGVKSMEIKNLDLTKECIITLKDIGIISINKNLTTTMTENSIMKLGLAGDDWFIYHNSLGAISQLLMNLIKNIPKKENIKKILPEQDVHLLIKNQAKIIESAVKEHGPFLDIEPSLSPVFGPLSDASFLKISKEFIFLSQNPPVKLATHSYETMSKRFIEDLLKHQEEIIQFAKSIKSNIVLRNYTEFLSKLMIELTNVKLKTYEKGFNEEIDLAMSLLFDCFSDKQSSYMFKEEVNELLSELEKNKEKNKEIIKKIKDKFDKIVK